MTTPPFQTRSISVEPDTLAPDGSEIRLLSTLPGMSLVHCSLPPGEVSTAVRHRTVGELWYFLSGEGEVWRSNGQHETVTSVRGGVSLSIPLGTTFQFRSTGPEPLCLVIATAPAWPGPDEAIPCAGKWRPA